MATTPTFGWDIPDDTDYVRDGYAAIDTLGNSIDTTLNVISGSTGSGDVPKMALDLITTVTIGTAVATVTVSNCFSSRYDAYKITVSGGNSSVNDDNLTMKLGSASTGHCGVLWYSGYTGGGNAAAVSNNSGYFYYVGSADTTSLNANIDVISPYLSEKTHVLGSYYDANNIGRTTSFHNSTTSFTSFTIGSNYGTLTDGTIRVYGYRNN